MGDLKNAKLFGGIGSILMLIGGFIPVAGAILPLIGLILVFVAVYYIAGVTKDQSIFKNYLLSFVLQIVAAIAVVAIGIIMVGATIGLTNLTDISQWTGTTSTTGVPDFGGLDIAALGMGCCAAIIVGWILMILASMFLKKSFTSISEHTQVGLFKTTGLIYLIGSALIIIGIGAIILLIAFILQIIAFFSLPDQLPGGTTAPA